MTRYWNPITARRERIRPRKMPNGERTPIPVRLFFAFPVEGRVTAPPGYAFNARGDLISRKRHARGRAA